MSHPHPLSPTFLPALTVFYASAGANTWMEAYIQANGAHNDAQSFLEGEGIHMAKLFTARD